MFNTQERGIVTHCLVQFIAYCSDRGIAPTNPNFKELAVALNAMVSDQVKRECRVVCIVNDEPVDGISASVYVEDPADGDKIDMSAVKFGYNDDGDIVEAIRMAIETFHNRTTA